MDFNAADFFDGPEFELPSDEPHTPDFRALVRRTGECALCGSDLPQWTPAQRRRAGGEGAGRSRVAAADGGHRGETSRNGGRGM